TFCRRRQSSTTERLIRLSRGWTMVDRRLPTRHRDRDRQLTWVYSIAHESRAPARRHPRRRRTAIGPSRTARVQPAYPPTATRRVASAGLPRLAAAGR